MADPQPIVCDYLKLPPEQQPFFKIRDTPFIFLEKLDRLTLVLVSAHESHPCPVALQIMRNLREAAGDQINYLAGVLFYGHRFANRYLELLGALTRVFVEQETIINVLRVNNNAGLAAEEMEGAQKAMAKFRQDVVDAVRHITEALNDNKSSGTTVFTADNSQVVTEFLDAIDECATLLQQNREYYREIEKQTEDEQSIKSSQPSDEEIKMMKERWTTFYTSVKGLRTGFAALQIKLVGDGDVQRVAGSYNNSQASANAIPTGSSSPADATNRTKIDLGCE